MANITGALTVKANDQEYTLWCGMSVLARLQEEHGQNILEKLEPPNGSDARWVPEMAVVVDLVRFSLERFHKDADRWTADDLIHQNPDLFAKLMQAAFPEQVEGKAKAPKRKAA